MIEAPRPAADALTSAFWDGCREGELRILRCDRCGRYIHWPRPVCSACLSTELSPRRVSGRGVLYSYTIADQAFHPWFADKVPYVLIVVELEEQPGLRMISNLVDHGDVYAVDDLVEVVFRPVEPDLVLPLFRPVRCAP
jgi:uncharacterized OB-fold protein